jgi:hypothetical protein
MFLSLMVFRDILVLKKRWISYRLTDHTEKGEYFLSGKDKKNNRKGKRGGRKPPFLKNHIGDQSTC